MKSNEVLQDVFKQHGAKKIASEMGLSVPFLYKWCQSDGGKATGGLNALERVAKLTEVTGDLRPLHWLCRDADGFFVENPAVKNGRAEWPSAGLAALKDLNQMETVLLETLAQPETPARTEQLRRLWEVSKSNVERVVRALEKGEFRRKLMAWFFKLYPFWDAATPGGLI